MTQNGRLHSDCRLPAADQIFLDHIGHFVRDPAAASAALARAGFAPTPVSVQLDPSSGAPTGTGNITAMLERGYVEVLFKTTDTPLGRELDVALARHAGVHLVAFAVADAAATRHQLAKRGFRLRPLVAMSRPVDAGGRPGTASFTVARLEPGEMPEGRIQALTHHTEDMVWQPRWLAHPNSALGLASVTIAVADVAETADRFARFTGRSARTTATGQVIDLDRGRLELVSAQACTQRLPDVPIPSLPFIAVYGISVRSLADVQSCLKHGGLTHRQTGEELVAPFPEGLGRGAWLFSETTSMP